MLNILMALALIAQSPERWNNDGKDYARLEIPVEDGVALTFTSRIGEGTMILVRPSSPDYEVDPNPYFRRPMRYRDDLSKPYYLRVGELERYVADGEDLEVVVREDGRRIPVRLPIRSLRDYDAMVHDDDVDAATRRIDAKRAEMREEVAERAARREEAARSDEIMRRAKEILKEADEREARKREAAERDDAAKRAEVERETAAMADWKLAENFTKIGRKDTARQYLERAIRRRPSKPLVEKLEKAIQELGD